MPESISNSNSVINAIYKYISIVLYRTAFNNKKIEPSLKYQKLHGILSAQVMLP